MKNKRPPHKLSRKEIEKWFKRYPQYNFDNFFQVRITKRRSFKINAFEKGDTTLGFIKQEKVGQKFGYAYVAVAKYEIDGEIRYERCGSDSQFFERIGSDKTT